MRPRGEKGRALVAFGVVALSSLSAVPARAGSQDSATAEALFEAGRQAMQRGDYAAACPKFAESQRLDPAAGTLLNLADCEERRNHLAAAWDAWHEAIRALAPNDDRLAPARRREQALDKRIPRLTVTLAAGAPADAQVHRDDVELKAASLGVALPLDPGDHTVRVDAPGRAPATIAVTLAEGESKTVEVAAGAPLAPVASAAPRPAPAPSAASSPSPAPAPPLSSSASPRPEQPSGHPALRTTGWIIGGVGVAALAGGATTGLLALSKKSVVQNHCFADKGCDSAGYDAAQSGHAFAIASDVLFAAGAVMTLAGAWLVWTNPSASAGATAVLVVPSPSGASVGLTRSF